MLARLPGDKVVMPSPCASVVPLESRASIWIENAPEIDVGTCTAKLLVTPPPSENGAALPPTSCKNVCPPAIDVVLRSARLDKAGIASTVTTTSESPLAQPASTSAASTQLL